MGKERDPYDVNEHRVGMYVCIYIYTIYIKYTVYKYE